MPSLRPGMCGLRTLPDEVASSGYPGSVYALSKWLERMVR